jgi:predicted peptidase
MYLHACHNDPVYPEYWIIKAANAVEPCAVFLPTAPPAIDFTCADWGGTYDEAMRPNMVDALAELDRVIQQNGFDSKRQYIYGESMGGEGVYRLLMDLPTRFAGAVSAAGYTKDKGAAQMVQTPLWIFHGAEDNTNPVDADQAITKSIKDAGGTKVKYTEYPGLDHVPGIEQARTEPGLFEWLVSQHR